MLTETNLAMCWGAWQMQLLQHRLSSVCVWLQSVRNIQARTEEEWSYLCVTWHFDKLWCQPPLLIKKKFVVNINDNSLSNKVISKCSQHTHVNKDSSRRLLQLPQQRDWFRTGDTTVIAQFTLWFETISIIRNVCTTQKCSYRNGQKVKKQESFKQL